MKIAMIGQKRIPSREGGIEVVVEELSTRLVELGHSVTCFNRKSKKTSNKVSVYKGIQLKEVLTIDKKGLAAVSSSFFACLKASLGEFDIVHIHAEGPAFFSFIPKLFGKKVVVTIHGLDWQRAKWGRFASKYIKFGERQAVKYADEIVVLSRCMQDYFKATYDRDTVFIPNGVSRPEVQEANEIKKLWNLEKDEYILFLGRIVPEKGLKYLVEAWKGVKTNKKLVIAGGSSDTDTFLMEMKKISKGNNVIFVGFQQGRVLEELYSNAYLYVLPSELEGMPLSLLEAMSYGNCCLVSDIAECTEVVEDKAVVFKKGDIADLKEKIQMLCDKEVLVKKYKNGTTCFICKKYSWDDEIDKTIELYRRKRQ